MRGNHRWFPLKKDQRCWDLILVYPRVYNIQTHPDSRYKRSLSVGSTSNWHRSDAKVIDLRVIGADPRVFGVGPVSNRRESDWPVWSSSTRGSLHCAIWRQGFSSTLVQVMACCLTAPSHYLNQCWLIINKVLWCSSEGNFTWDITAISH